ncbi:MAG: DNA-binding protein [Firmicutes bacterium HGW-Firmicutes-15]|nr:MAG: DNA-binding protein [Firmicutes bacterium HGW-Firmicutes-15]
MTKDKNMKETIIAKGTEIAVISGGDENDYISLTDIAKYKTDENPGYVIQNWMRNRNVVRFLGLWEKINNSGFNCLEFEAIENEAGLNSFVLTPKKWVEKTGAIGITTKQGRYAATFAHLDVAFEFASWISPEFKLYIIKDYQRLKADENSRLSLGWNLNRTIAKINYRIHTDAIKDVLIPPDVTPQKQNITYANEADLLNVALFGVTAKEWRQANPDAKGNIRDEASLQQLIVLANMESLNAEFIRQGLPQKERLLRLNASAKHMMRSLLDSAAIERLKRLEMPKG